MSDLAKMLRAVEMLRRRVHKAMPSQHLSLLLAVADCPGITMPELGRVLNMPQGTVSRNVKVLSHYVEREAGGVQPKGRNLLRTQPDPGNPHCLAVFLTGRGEAVVEELRAILYPESVDKSSAQAGEYSNFVSGLNLTH